MIKKIIYFTIIALFISCENNNERLDCSNVLCAAPHVLINLIDKSTEENFIVKNSIIEENIIIRDASNNDIEFSLNETNGLLFIDKQNKTDTFEIHINSEIITTFSFDTTNPNTNECCDFGKLKNVVVDKEFEVEENSITIYL